ncbi:MAG: EAL domain-containing protein [Lachnospiraceae bacterium]|nr:EAL domain-containing protein [Lachnospiraceae bacterium]
MDYLQMFICIILTVLSVLLVVCIIQNYRIQNKMQTNEEELLDNYRRLKEAYDKEAEEKRVLTERCEELIRSKEHMQKTAGTDYLTGLPNRFEYTEHLKEELRDMKSDGLLGIIDLDIDNFRNINDSYGHFYGDQTLCEVTRRLTRFVLERDAYLARVGGDGFSVILKDFSERAELEAQVVQLLNYLKDPYHIGEREFMLTLSAGVVVVPTDGTNEQTITKNVDMAKFFAKASGKDTYIFYDDSLDRSVTEKLELQTEVRKAIEDEAFEVYFQPQIDLATEETLGFEALVRWNHPERGVIVPSEFIPVAEECGLIVPLGEFVLRESCKKLKKWQDEGCRQVVAVNLSARQFKDRESMDNVMRIIRETGINPKQLELEITETMALDDLDYAINTLQKLKQLGVSIALDDFGTGYSSLNYLKRLPVNQLKIDKSFMDNVLEDHSDQKIVETIIALAQALNLVVVAEGVENSAQADFLKSVSCDKAQGYLYSKPLREKDMLGFLQTN